MIFLMSSFFLISFPWHRNCSRSLLHFQIARYLSERELYLCKEQDVHPCHRYRLTDFLRHAIHHPKWEVYILQTRPEEEFCSIGQKEQLSACWTKMCLQQLVAMLRSWTMHLVPSSTVRGVCSDIPIFQGYSGIFQVPDLPNGAVKWNPICLRKWGWPREALPGYRGRELSTGQ